MIQVSAPSLLSLAACSFLLALWVCAFASRRVLRRSRFVASAEPISVVIPLRGADIRLSENLRAWIEVSYASAVELIAVADSDSDPAWRDLDAAERGATGRRFRRVVSQGLPDWLPKVRALQTGLDAAHHSRLVFANSDVLITPSVLAEVVARSRLPGTGAAYAHPVVVNPLGVGGVLDAAVTNFTSLIVQPLLASARLDCVAGDLWAAGEATLRRARLFESIRGEIADDLAASRRLRALGLELDLCSQPVTTQRASMTALDFYHHQLMWLRLWHRYAPLGRATAVLFSPLAWAIAACVLDSSYWPLAVCVGMGEMSLAAWIALFLNRRKPEHRVILATPLALFCEQVIAVLAFFGRRVRWVGRQYVLGRDIRVIPDASCSRDD